MSEQRLGGKGIAVDDFTLLDKVHVHVLPSMGAAREKFITAFSLPYWAKNRAKHKPFVDAMAQRMMCGDKRLESIMEKADALIDEALLIDPRLVRRSGWVMAEEGIDACPAMIAAGEERAYIDRRKMKLSDQTASTTQPVRIVISTDSKHITQENASAFIAAAKLAQQFRPLEIWWQGAWLKEDDEPAEAGYGHVFLVPLVSGDLDFARLQFVLSDADRDKASYFVMVKHAFELKKGWGGKVGEESYLPDTFDFIRESGMSASAGQVAAYAANWAGLESRWDAEVSNSSARQFWQVEGGERTTYQPPKALTPAEQKARDKQDKKWERDYEARRKKELRAKAHQAKERLAI